MIYQNYELRFIETFHPVAAAITNVAVDHLDWHGSEYSYRSSKARIYANQTSSDLLVYDSDDEGATELASSAPSETYPISGKRLPLGGGGVDEGRLVVGEVSIDIADLVSQDSIHLANLACAAVLALRMGATDEAVAQGAIGYRPAKHRRSLVQEAHGIRWVDDSKATNPHAAVASIRDHSSVVLIAGGMARSLKAGARRSSSGSARRDRAWSKQQGGRDGWPTHSTLRWRWQLLPPGVATQCFWRRAVRALTSLSPMRREAIGLQSW